MKSIILPIVGFVLTVLIIGACSASPSSEGKGGESGNSSSTAASVPAAATPEFTPVSGNFTNGVIVNIFCGTPGAVIQWTTNGSDWITGSSVAISNSMTLQAKATATGYSDSETATAVYNIIVVGKVSTPTFNPPAGTYTTSVVVNINCATPGATILWSTNGGTDWNVGSSVTLNKHGTITARATNTVDFDSDTTSAIYYLKAALPTFTPSPGLYTNSVTVNMSCATPGATVLWSTNYGSSWTAGTSLDISNTLMLYVRATNYGMYYSGDTNGNYTIKVAKPYFNPAAGNYTNAVTVNILCDTPGAAIYWSTNGTAWTAGSSILLTNTRTLRAYATKTGLMGSDTNISAFNILQPLRFSRVSCGKYYSLGLKSDGTLWGTGYNGSGQLGTNNSSYSNWIQLLTGVSKIAAGDQHSLALKTDGTLWVAGNNNAGQLGRGNFNPALVWTQVLTSVADIEAGCSNSFAVKTDGTLWAAGYNNGMFGNGNMVSTNNWIFVLSNVSKVSVGYFHNLALKTDSSLWATGENSNGQLGTSNYTKVYSWTYVLTNIAAIAAGGSHSLAASKSSICYTTGLNNYGQIFWPSTSFTNIWKDAGIDYTIDVAADRYHSFFVRDDGAIIKRQLCAAGDNQSGQLGLGSIASTNLAITFSLVTNISTGYGHSILIQTNGTVWSTGLNNYGQLGKNDTVNTNDWVQIFQ